MPKGHAVPFPPCRRPLCCVCLAVGERTDNIGAFSEQTRGFARTLGAPAVTRPLVWKMAQSDLRLRLTATRSRKKGTFGDGVEGASARKHRSRSVKGQPTRLQTRLKMIRTTSVERRCLSSHGEYLLSAPPGGRGLSRKLKYLLKTFFSFFFQTPNQRSAGGLITGAR